MEWGALLLLVVSIYAGWKAYGLSQEREGLKFEGLAITCLVFGLIQLVIIIDGILSSYEMTLYSGIVLEWGHIICLALVLSSLAIFIRESKPVFAQFPMIYTALPLLIVLSYFLVVDTYAIKDWLISIYQGGAILVALLMYSVYTYRNHEYAPVLAGTGMFLLTFLLYWYLPIVSEVKSWLWKVLFSFSILLTVYGYEKAHKALHIESQNL